MTTNDSRVAHWLGLVCELLRDPLAEMPIGAVMRELRATFDVVAVTWQWRDPVGRAGFEIDRPEVLASVSSDQRAEWSEPEVMRRHPLVRWYDVVQDPRAQTSGRVPRSIVPERDVRFALGILRPLEGDQQLALPYVLGPTEHLAFVLARTRRDFSDDDLEVARRLQPALVALHRQSQVLATAERSATRSALEAGLTGREYAVLRLLADGHTALSIARRLSMSARTVHKHLEHIYRKLGVNDRLSAVRVASCIGILQPALNYELNPGAGAASLNDRQVRTSAYAPQAGDRRSWSAMESVR